MLPVAVSVQYLPIASDRRGTSDPARRAIDSGKGLNSSIRHVDCDQFADDLRTCLCEAGRSPPEAIGAAMRFDDCAEAQDDGGDTGRNASSRVDVVQRWI